MIRFFGGRVLTLKNNSLDITDDEVWVDGDKIVFIGKYLSLIHI